jgi:SAM-dependent methyltransferase
MSIPIYIDWQNKNILNSTNKLDLCGGTPGKKGSDYHKQTLKLLIDNGFNNNHQILDYGCGTGALYVCLIDFLRNIDTQYCGIEMSIEAYKYLISNFKKENQEAFGKFLNFANAFQSKVHLLQINTPSQFENTADSKQKIKNFIEKYDLPKFSINIYNDNSVEKGILNFSRERKVDLIALSTHGRSGISHLFVGSVAKNLSKKALKPMFTVKV